MMNSFYLKNTRSVLFSMLLSLLMCVVGASKASADEVVPRNPIVKIISGPTYSDNGTEVSLRLWMYNYDGDNAYFINDVYLTIDGSNVVKLNGMWSLFSNTYNEDNIKKLEKSGNVGRQGTMMLNGEKIGTAQFCNVKKNQMCDYNKYYKEDKWTTVDLKLSFNNSLSYRRHSINVKGKWRDWCDSKKVADKVWDISNQINGFYYPDPNDFTAKRIGDDLKFEWHYGTTVGLHESMRQGKWVLYKKLKGSSNFEKIGEVKVGNSLVLTIKCRDFVCGATYYVTFNPSALSNTPIINGLTATLTHEHVINSNNTCDICKHFLFTYTTSDGKPVPLANNLDFGAKMLSHTADGKGNCLIDFDYNITRIPDNAFSGTKINGRLVIPSTVKYIGARAFANTACNEISLSVGLEEIGDGAFEKCYNINKLPLPRTLKKIGSRAFMGCLSSGTLKIPGNVTEIGDYAFSGCKYLTKLTLTNSLQRIGAYAFDGCLKLDCELQIPNSVTEIGDGAFKNCSMLSGKLTLPGKLTRIGSEVFANCENFSGDLVIPNGVTEIGNNAFDNCTGFTGKLSLPHNLRKIEYAAFARCINLSGPLSIPETVKEIGSYAFYNCTGFTGDFVLPSALESIGTDAFANTQDKNRLVFQSLPKGMQNGYHDCKMRRYVNLSDASYVSDDAYAYLSGASYVRTMTNTWGSLVLPYDMLLPSDAPYSVFTIEKMTNDEVVLKRCTFILNPGVAYIVRRDGEEKTLTFSPDRSVEIRMKMQPADVGNLKFSGTYQAKEVTDGYILAQDRFWNVAKLKAAAPETQAVMVGPFRSWLEGTTANTSPSLSMRIGDSTTGIDNVAPLEMLNANDAEYYDLNGKRLDAPMKGVNIVKRGNKTMKVIIK